MSYYFFWIIIHHSNGRVRQSCRRRRRRLQEALSLAGSSRFKSIFSQVISFLSLSGIFLSSFNIHQTIIADDNNTHIQRKTITLRVKRQRGWLMCKYTMFPYKEGIYWHGLGEEVDAYMRTKWS